MGESEGAIDDLSQAVRLDPTLFDAYEARAKVRFELGDREGAPADFERALQLNPNYALAYGNRGNARAKMEDLVGAIADYDRAIQIDPTYADAYHNRGLLRGILRSSPGALEDLRIAAAQYRARGTLPRIRKPWSSMFCSSGVALQFRNRGCRTLRKRLQSAARRCSAGTGLPSRTAPAPRRRVGGVPGARGCGGAIGTGPRADARAPAPPLGRVRA